MRLLNCNLLFILFMGRFEFLVFHLGLYFSSVYVLRVCLNICSVFRSRDTDPIEAVELKMSHSYMYISTNRF